MHLCLAKELHPIGEELGKVLLDMLAVLFLGPSWEELYSSFSPWVLNLRVNSSQETRQEALTAVRGGFVHPLDFRTCFPLIV